MNSLIPLGVFFSVQIIVAQYTKKAMETLTLEEKGKILECTSKNQGANMIPIVIMIFAFGAFMFFSPSLTTMMIGLSIYMLLMAGFSIYRQNRTLTELTQAGLPQHYLSRIALYTKWQIGASLCLFAWLLGSSLYTVLSVPSRG